MKKNTPTKRQNSLILIGSIAALLSAPVAKATNLYWDTNNTAAGAVTGAAAVAASGIWGVNSFWTTDSSGTTANTYQSTTTSADTLYFWVDPATTAAALTNSLNYNNGTIDNSLKITVSGTQSANGIVLQTANSAGTRVDAIITGGQINLGSGGITIAKYATGSLLNVSQFYLYSTVNLTADQTWTANNSNANGGIYIYGNLTGSGNLLLTSTDSNERFVIGNGASSTGWTGALTLDGGQLTFANSQQAVTRLNSSTLTLKNNATTDNVNFTPDTGAVTNFSNNITFAGTHTTNGYNINYANSGQRGASLLLSGTLSGNLTNYIEFQQGSTVDLSGTGQWGRFRISGDNSNLTTSVTGTSPSIIVRTGYLYLDNNNALGLNNKLTVQIGAYAMATRNASGLYLSNGITYNGNINVTIKSTLMGEAFLGLDGTGSALYTGTITMNNNSGGANQVNNLHLWALAGGTATFSGAIVDGGSAALLSSLYVDGGGVVALTGTSSYFGNTVVNAGTLKLDFASSSATSNILNSGATNKSALVLGGGTLNVVGKNATANSQRFNGTTVNTGASTIQLSSAATSGSLALTLGALTRSTAGTVDFILPSGTQSAANGISTASTTSVSSGILVSAATNGVAYATVGGSTWAALSGSNIVGFNSYNVDTYNNNDNTDVTTDGNVAAGSSVNTLRFNNATAHTVTLNGATTVSTGGILVTSTAANGATITGGSLQTGGGNEFVFINNGKLRVDSVIADNGNATALTISGTGVTTLGGVNTYSGVTTVNRGTLSVSSTAALGTATSAVVLGDNGNKGTLSYTGGNVTYNRGFIIGTGGGELDVAAGATVALATGGVTYQSSTGSTYGNFTIGGAGNVSIGSTSVLALGYGGLIMNGTGLLTISSASTYSGDTVINSGTLALGLATAISSSSAIILNGGTLDLGNNSSARIASVTLNSGVIQNGTLALGSDTLYATSGTVSAVISGGGTSLTGSLIKTGTGTLLLSGSNTYSGLTDVQAGILLYGRNDVIRDGAAVQVSGGTLDISTYNDTVGAFTMTSGTLASTTGTFTGASYNFTNSGTVTAKLGGTALLSKSGTGTVVLSASNSYTGGTTINGGKLAVNGVIGAATVNSGGILGGSGTVGAVTVNSGGHFAPSNSISTTFQTGALTLGAGSITDIELGNSTGAGTRLSPWLSDRTTVSGSLVLGGTLNLIDNAGALTSAGSAGGSIAAGSYLIFTGATGSVRGSYSDIVNVSGYHAKVDSTTTAGSVYVDNYQIASASITSGTTVSLGITHVGQGFTSSTLNIKNTGTNNGYSEGLNATASGMTGAATLAGGITNLAGGSTSTALTVGLGNTATAGAKTGTATVGFASNGSTTSGYGTTSLDSQTVTVNGQVNYYADPTLTAVSGGDLTETNATHYTLSLGSYNLNTGEYTATISLNNFLHDATYQDLLSGTFDTSAKGLFTLVGFDGTLEAIASGTNVTLTVSFNTTDVAQGDYTGTILFNPTSANASGTSSLSAVSLGLEFTVVPEPATWAMIVGGMGMLAFGQSLRRRMS